MNLKLVQQTCGVGYSFGRCLSKPCSASLFLKLYFARDIFLEIHFCVILQGIQNFFGPDTAKISSEALSCTDKGPFFAQLWVSKWHYDSQHYVKGLNDSV